MKIYSDRIINLFAGVLIFCMVACERTAQIEYPEMASRLVVHCYTAVGDTFKLALGKTQKLGSPLVDSLSFVNNGWVLLYEDGLFRDSMKLNAQAKRYIASTVAVAGHKYKILAGAPGFQSVEAESGAPPMIPTINVSRVRNARFTSFGFTLDDLSFSFQDPSAEKNYYITALYTPWSGTGFCVYSYDPAVEKYKGDPLPFSTEYCIQNTEIIFSDKSFNGTLKSITLSTNSMQMDSIIDPLSGNRLRAYAKRYNITEDYYKYFKDRMTLDLGQGSPTFSDPVLIRGNVKKGYGLFTVFALTTDSIP